MPDKQVSVGISASIRVSGAEEAARAAEEQRSAFNAAGEAAIAMGGSAEEAMQRAADATRGLSDVIKTLPDDIQRAFKTIMEQVSQQNFSGALDSIGRAAANPAMPPAAVNYARDLATNATMAAQAGVPNAGATAVDGSAQAARAIEGAARTEADIAAAHARSNVILNRAQRRLDLLEGTITGYDADASSLTPSTLKGLRGRAAEIGGDLRVLDGLGDGAATGKATELTDRLAHLARVMEALDATLSGRTPSAAPDAVGDGRAMRMLQRAEGRLDTLESAVLAADPKSITRSGLRGLQARAASIGGDLTVAGTIDENRNEDRARELSERLETLNKSISALGDQSGAGSQGGDAPERRNPLGKLGDFAQREVGRLGSIGMGGMGMAGRALSLAGPIGLAVGAAVGGALLLDRALTSGNRAGREEISGITDLARQYGRDGTPFVFRNNANVNGDLFTQDALLRIGYTASDAARTASLYDLPTAGGRNLFGDTLNMLQFSRSTGLDESRVASSMHTLGMAGTFGAEGNQNAMQSLRWAVATGLKDGISQSETMQNLVGLVEKNFREGRGSSQTALAFQAALQSTLAGTGSKALAGAAGAAAQGSLMNAATGQGSDPMQLALYQRIGDIDADDLAFETDAEAAGYRELQASIPFRAFQVASARIAAGANPALAARFGAAMDATLGHHAGITFDFLKSHGMTDAATLATFGAGGMDAITEEAAQKAQEANLGLPTNVDTQGGNALDQQTRALAALKSDNVTVQSLGQLAITGNLEATIMNAKVTFTRGWTDAMQSGNALRDMTMGRPAGFTPRPTTNPLVVGWEGAGPSGMPVSFGDVAVGAAMGGVESNGERDALNARTGAFGPTQIMSSNFLGAAGWDREFMNSDAGRAMEWRMMQAGLSPTDPIPDRVAKQGGAAVADWRAAMPHERQVIFDDFMLGMSKNKLNEYYDRGIASGMDPREAQMRATASWYGGPNWIDKPNDPRYALDPSNPRYTTGQGANNEEPSIMQYVNDSVAGQNAILEKVAAASAQSGIQTQNVIVNVDLGDLTPETQRVVRQNLHNASAAIADEIRIPQGTTGP